MAINEKATVEVQVNGEQAKNELRNLEKYASSLKGQIDDAYNAGDTKKVKQLTKELRSTESQMRTLKKSTTELNQVMQNLSGATPKELRNTLKAINRELDSGNIRRGSAEWKQYQAQAKLVSAELAKIKAEVRESEGWLTRFNNGFSRWGAMLASGAAALTGVSLALNSMRKNRDAKESSQASLKSLTGLDDQSIQWLTEQADVLSTSMEKSGLRIRQSSEEILKAYTVVGSKKPELLQNKEALNQVTIEAMRLASAAGIELESAVEAATISLNMFNAGADQAAKYVNVLAAGSKVGAANVSAQAEAIKNSGVAAAGAGVSIEGLQGTIQMLAEKGIEAERAGTALRKFFLVLQTGENETNPAVVGLDKALDNLNKKSLSAGQIQKMFGDEAFSAASILIQNSTKVKEYTDAVTDTNIATEQATINSATNEAKMAQLKNQIKETGIQLMEKLNPSLSALTGWTTKIIRIMPEVIDFFKEHGTTIIKLTGLIASYYAGIRLATIYETRLKEAKLLTIAADKLRVIWTTTVMAKEYAAMTVTTLFTRGMGSLGARVLFSKECFKVLFQTLKLNPFGLILTLVTAIGYGIYKLATYTTEADKAMKEFSKQNIKEQSELQKLKSAIDNANVGSKERSDLIKEFNSKYGSYITKLLNEKSTVLDIASAYREAATAIQNKLALQTIEKKKEEITEKSLDKRGEAMQQVQDILTNALPSSLADKVRSTVLDYINTQLGNGKTIQQVTKGVTDSLHKSYKQIGTGDLIDINSAVKNYAEIVSEDMQQIASIEKKLGAVIVKPKENKKIANELEEIIVTPENKGTSIIPGSNEENKSKENPKVIAETKRYQEELTQLKRTYLKDNSMTQQQYAAKNEEIEMKHLDEMLKIAGLEPEKRKEVEDKILDLKIKAKEKLREEIKNQETQERDDYKSYQNEQFSLMEKDYQLEVQKLGNQYLSGILKKQEYYDKLKELQKSYEDGLLSSTDITQEKKNEIIKKRQDEEISESDKAQDEKLEKLKQNAQTMMDLGASMGSAFADFITNTETTLGDFAKNIIKLMLDTLQKIMVGAIAERTIKNIATLGPLGIAKSVGEIALITAAFETAKAALGGFYNGGYTGSGEWNEPKGIVHSNEFVANRYAVGNPNIRPVLDLINRAQQNNTIGSLSSKDVSKVINVPSAVSSIQSNDSGSNSNDEMTAILYQTGIALNKLKERLDKKIVAETYITGKRGIDKTMSEYNDLINNVQR